MGGTTDHPPPSVWHPPLPESYGCLAFKGHPQPHFPSFGHNLLFQTDNIISGTNVSVLLSEPPLDGASQLDFEGGKDIAHIFLARLSPDLEGLFAFARVRVQDFRSQRPFWSEWQFVIIQGLFLVGGFLSRRIQKGPNLMH